MVNRAEYFWMVERNGLTILCEDDVLGNKHYLREIPSPPYRFHAVSKNGGPNLFIDVGPGEEYIWEHNVRDSIAVFSGERRIEDCLIFGKRHPIEGEKVMRVYPDGQRFEFTSLAQARAHTR